MKELSIEEKARRYDEAVEKARQLCAYPTTKPFISDLQDLFPELAESEDERIRKDIISYLKSSTAVSPKTWIAWLEKQGEQKSTDKPEPKFKVGDWIVCEITGSVYQIRNCIENLSNHKYGYDLTNGGYIGSDEVNHYHLWTIQDAKDGDVLVASDDSIFIYAGSTDRHAKFYVASTKWGTFNLEAGNWEDKNRVHPATKEQRDLLFQKLKEAGYSFDFEKKELKKIEQNHAEDSCKNSDDITTEEKDRTEYNKGFECGKQRVLKYPEDFGLCKNLTAWSEEDEDMIQALNACINTVIRSGMNYISFDSKSILIEKVKNWLKSIKERYTWKPSEEQMSALSKAIAFVSDSNSDVKHSLESLYNELKKL